MCAAHPCEEGEVCLKRGGASCLSRRGCRAKHFRSCVDPNALRCRRRGNDTEDVVNGDSEEEAEGKVW